MASPTTDFGAILVMLRAEARRHSRVPDEAEDLLQDALLEAARAGRGDLTQAVNYRWLVGTMRNLGAMTARGAVRRRLRESKWTLERLPPNASAWANVAVTSYAASCDASCDATCDASCDASCDATCANTRREWLVHPAVVCLPPSLRDVARLALAGHDRREIAWLLRLSDTAMRQRIAALKRKLGAFTIDPHDESHHDTALPLGLIRRALLPVVVATDSAGAHDPDGHLLILSRDGAHVLPERGNKTTRTFPPSPHSLEPSQ